MVDVHGEAVLSGGYNMRYSLTPDAKRDAIRRISYVQGHLQGVRRMIVNGEGCLEVLRQTYAIRRAVAKLEALILEVQLRALEPTDLAEGREEALGELLYLYEISGRYSHH